MFSDTLHIGHQASSDARDHYVEQYLSSDVRNYSFEHNASCYVRNYYVEQYYTLTYTQFVHTSVRIPNCITTVETKDSRTVLISAFK